MNLSLKDFYQGFRDPQTIKALALQIEQAAQQLDATPETPLKIMEVCGGHTHTIMKYGLGQILPNNIEFIHGPGCPVCIMPKERIDHAIVLAKMDNTILLTLGDMIRVPGSKSSLAKTRAAGADIRALYTPLDAIKIAQENPDKQVIFFAIGFETTTPMTAAVIKQAIALKLNNLFFHINHVLVPPAVVAIMQDDRCQIDALIGPSHVSVVSGAKIYLPLAEQFQVPIVVSGFEPVDVMQSILKIIQQVVAKKHQVEIQYSRAVSLEGNITAQQLIATYLEPRSHFRWRGLGDIPLSGLGLKAAYTALDAEKVFADQLSNEPIDDHKLCICGDILRGLAKPKDCKVFGRGCDPTRPLGSCMVSSEGACHAYYKYAEVALPSSSQSVDGS
ncbi:MAG: hydrogenase expression/formation protein HypD [Thiomicrorhabdus sp.]|nr:MAG: hydrogenase expression/formation protein HypD [Thiomicrorhabdus sp.]